MKGATLFTGFGGVDIGMKAAGIDVRWGIEYDDKIAGVARNNLGNHIMTANVLECDPSDFEAVNLLHASPPCPNFSNAKTNGEESDNDRALAVKVAEFIRVLLPDFFTLENVYQYRNSESWRIIAAELMTHGYTFNYWHVNAADYGVPQTRKRMIVIARRDGRTPMLPPATHDEHPQVGLFGTRRKWIGWYEAIEDLIPTLPDSKFADWQLRRLPEELFTFLLSQDYDGNGAAQQRSIDEPVTCIRASASNAMNLRAFIVSGGQGDQTNGENRVTNKLGNEPIMTVTAGEAKRPSRAFIIDGKLSTSGNEKILQINDRDAPSGTIVSSHAPLRDARAYVGGRVVKMTTCALARFQSFPDWYELPKSNRLAAHGIGNAVPPLLYQRIAESLVQG